MSERPIFLDPAGDAMWDHMTELERLVWWRLAWFGPLDRLMTRRARRRWARALEKQHGWPQGTLPT